MWQREAMAKMIQVRNVSDRLHRELLQRAHARGLTLTAYVEDLLERDIERPPLDEVLARIRRHKKVRLPISAAELVRRGRRE